MPSNQAPARLKKEFRRLRRSMDFASTHRSLGSPRSKLGRHLVEIYQQLGLVWEFLALQCRHEEGYRTARSGLSVCRICGTVKGTREQWLLLPRGKRKAVRKKIHPASATTDDLLAYAKTSRTTGRPVFGSRLKPKARSRRAV